MSFDTKYKDIKNIVQEDLNFLEKNIVDLFKDKTPLNEYLSKFLTYRAKRLRPLLGYLFLRCAFNEVNRKQHNLLLAIELMHNATLIHDDVIDNAQIRRNEETLNSKFDDNFAVVSGDFLLSVAMEKIIDTSVEVVKICTSALKTTCLGEINQYFSKFNVTSIEEYVEKSKNKTALLFQIGVLGGVMLSDKSNDFEKSAIDFAKNFGIAFQIRDDLINVLSADNLSGHDVELGIYTAPVIYAYQENENLLNEENILIAIKKTQGIEKTKNLMDNYFDKSISALNDFDNNIYKEAILRLIDLLRENF